MRCIAAAFWNWPKRILKIRVSNLFANRVRCDLALCWNEYFWLVRFAVGVVDESDICDDLYKKRLPES